MSLDTQSRSRRKPLRTYKSPATGDQRIIPRSTVSSPSSSSTRCKPTKSPKCSPRANHAKKDNNTQLGTIARYQYPQSPPLPLFHPLGRLAMSLPPLDPTSYGLPLLAVPDELEHRHRSRHGAGKRSREAEDDGEVGPGMSAVAAREKGSPRKRRTGGGNKRRRKDGDDGDASYPAKRTRTQRGQNGEEETGIESPDIGGSGDGMLSELVEKRRSARSRGGTTTTAVSARRGSSSSSEATTGLNDADMIVTLGHENKGNGEEGVL